MRVAVLTTYQRILQELASCPLHWFEPAAYTEDIPMPLLHRADAKRSRRTRSGSVEEGLRASEFAVGAKECTVRLAGSPRRYCGNLMHLRRHVVTAYTTISGCLTGSPCHLSGSDTYIIPLTSASLDYSPHSIHVFITCCCQSPNKKGADRYVSWFTRAIGTHDILDRERRGLTSKA